MWGQTNGKEVEYYSERNRRLGLIITRSRNCYILIKKIFSRNKIHNYHLFVLSNCLRRCMLVVYIFVFWWQGCQTHSAMGWKSKIHTHRMASFKKKNKLIKYLILCADNRVCKYLQKNSVSNFKIFLINFANMHFKKS